MVRRRPSHTPKSFKARHIFTDRDESREIFASTLAKTQSNEKYHLLNFYGIGGQGKSALCEQFTIKLEQEKQKNKDLGWAKLDFEISENRLPANALLSIRLQLAERCKISFPAFDTAFARYFAFARQGHNLKDTHPDLFKQADDVLQDIESVVGDIVEEVPGVGLIYKYFKKLSISTKHWWERRGKEILEDLDSLDQNKLLQELPAYLGADIYDWLFKEQQSSNKRRLVILLDTYEALWRNQPTKNGLEAMRVDAWLRKLVEETPGVFYVVLGRDKLAWTEVDNDWESDIDAHLLGGLSAEDANNFLLNVPIAEDEIRSKIIENSQGIPFYLDLQVDLYESLKQQDTKPQVSDFGNKEEEILSRFIDHLAENDRRALQVLSHARFLNEKLVLSLAKKFLGGEASVNIKQFSSYSFWKEQNKVWVLHGLMREYLQSRQLADEKELFNKIHLFLFEKYDSPLESLKQVVDIKDSHSQALAEAAYHLQQFDIKKLPRWASERGQLFYKAYAWQEVEELWESTLEIAENHLGKEDVDTATVLGDLANMYQAQGKYEQAEPLYQRSLSISEKALGKDHPSVATTLNNLAQLFKAQGKYEQAEPLYQRDLSISEKALGKDHPEVATTLNNLAQLYQAQGKYEQAEPLYQRSLSIKEKALGKDHPSVATTLNNLAGLYESQGKYEQAEPLYQRALVILKAKFPDGHPNIDILEANYEDLKNKID